MKYAICEITRPSSAALPPHPDSVVVGLVVVVGSLSWDWCCWCWLQCSAVGNSSRTRSQFRARHCCVQRACTLGLSTVRARSQPGQLPPLPRPQLTADITPVTRVPLTCENVLLGPPPHHRPPPGHDGVPGVRGLQLQGSHGVHSVILSGPRPGQARGEDGPRTQGSGYWGSEEKTSKVLANNVKLEWSVLLTTCSISVLIMKPPRGKKNMQRRRFTSLPMSQRRTTIKKRMPGRRRKVLMSLREISGHWPGGATVMHQNRTSGK